MLEVFILFLLVFLVVDTVPQMWEKYWDAKIKIAEAQNKEKPGPWKKTQEKEEKKENFKRD